jgi:tRNA (cmo5U34)-methyltransferase
MRNAEVKRRLNSNAGNSARIWQSETVAKHYLEGVRGAIPLAQTQIEVMLFILEQGRRKIRRFLDLGCGDGILGRAVLSRYTQAKAVFLDFSESMLAAARDKLKGIGHDATFVTRDYGQPGWAKALAAHAPFDAVVSGFSIHHQLDARKKEIYTELLDLLAPGGCFLNLEHVASASSRGQAAFDRYFIASLCEYHKRAGTGKTPRQIAREYYHRPDKAANILAPVEDQCQWLRAIGFEDVDCYFKIFELALFGGRKPGLSVS